MRNSKRITTLAVLFVACSAFATISNTVFVKQSSIEVTPEEVITITPEVKVENITNELSTKNFLQAIGRRESSNRYYVVNKWGYMGKYQFGRKTLDNLGYKHVTNKQFLNTPSIQEQAMKDLLKHNRKILKRQIKIYDNKLVHGVYVTESGLLAAAHLAGPGNVKKWLRNGKVFKDGLGTPLTSYIKMFGGYNIDLYIQ